MHPAVIVIDMIVDFTTGRLGSPQARAIRPAIKRLLNAARRKKIPVIYSQDSHLPTDPEMKVWGPHGMFGTKGAQTDPQLKPKAGEMVIPKHVLDIFFGNNLEDVLKEHRIDTVILAGVATELCVQHGAGGAAFRGLKGIVAKECVAPLDPSVQEAALRYMKRAYGTAIASLGSVLKMVAKTKRISSFVQKESLVSSAGRAR